MEFQRLAHTDWVLTDPFVVRKDMSPERKNVLRVLFVHMREREGGREVTCPHRSNELMTTSGLSDCF